VKEISLRFCKIEGRQAGKSPPRQAYEAAESLRFYLRTKLPEPPYIVSTSCWPIILRTDWVRVWGNSGLGSEYADSMIFSEDMNAGPGTLARRLLYIRRNPPVRAGTKRSFKHSPEALTDFIRALNPIGKRVDGDSPVRRFARVEYLERIRRR